FNSFTRAARSSTLAMDEESSGGDGGPLPTQQEESGGDGNGSETARKRAKDKKSKNKIKKQSKKETKANRLSTRTAEEKEGTGRKSKESDGPDPTQATEQTSKRDKDGTEKESAKESTRKGGQKERGKTQSEAEKQKTNKKEKSVSHEGTIYNNTNGGDVARIPEGKEEADDYYDKSETVKRGKSVEKSKKSRNPFSIHNRPNAGVNEVTQNQSHDYGNLTEKLAEANRQRQHQQEMAPLLPAPTSPSENEDETARHMKKDKKTERESKVEDTNREVKGQSGGGMTSSKQLKGGQSSNEKGCGKRRKISAPAKYRSVWVKMGGPRAGGCACMKRTTWEFARVWPKCARIGITLYWIVFIILLIGVGGWYSWMRVV
ncbi:hypothetical protein PFISCL1PPCAC_4749, partial [Pristionchus fissidentatus]